MMRIICVGLLLCLLQACAVNPVTGRNELSIVSEAQERSIGAQQYGPAQQSQGGQYEVDEGLTRYVSQVGQRIAAVSDRPLDYEFVVLNNGVPNAWALPGGKIAVNRGLLVELNNEAELAAVLGHEVVHAAARHGAQAMTRGTLLQGALLVGMVAASGSEYADYVVGGSMLGAQLITQRYGRDAERESDHYGIEYMVRAGYDPRAAVSLQQTFVRLSEGRDPGWLEGLFASHPPSQERVRNNQALVNQLLPTLSGRDLELGERRYRDATAFLRDTRQAYDLFEEAERAVGSDELELAMDKVEQAIALVPQEARFLGLKGDILVYQRRYREAVPVYDQALALDDDYFDYYLGRGVARARLNQGAAARRDLERSSELLPTAIAQNELGKLSLAAGDRNAAKTYFSTAAMAQGLVGQEAATSFMQLDLSDNPARYVQAQALVDRSGRIHARVFNQSPVTLRDVQIQVSALIDGQVRRQLLRVATLPANRAVDVASQLGFARGSTWTPDMLAAQVVAAEL
ncbi:MAG TPA: M48 family metalloprotease [Hyphomicrobiales bacterium]|nr:M48 family metalloprotease [Hyphomicrobiales bacterium]